MGKTVATDCYRTACPLCRLAKLKPVQQALATKLFSAMFGLLGYGVTFLIRFMPGMLEAAMVVGGVTNGPIMGVFTGNTQNFVLVLTKYDASLTHKMQSASLPLQKVFIRSIQLFYSF